MNTYKISYEYKGFLETIEITADNLLMAIIIAVKQNIELSEIIKIELK